MLLEVQLARQVAAAAASAFYTPLATRPGTPSNPAGFFRRATSRVDLPAFVAHSTPGTPNSVHNKGSGHIASEGSNGQYAQGHTRTMSANSAAGLSNGSVSHQHALHPPNGHGSSMLAIAIDPLDITEPIETPQQFMDWYATVEASMESEQEEVFRSYQTEVDAYIDSCTEAMEMLEDSRGLIKEMEANYRYVEENSRALQMACETMLDEQVNIQNFVKPAFQYENLF